MLISFILVVTSVVTELSVMDIVAVVGVVSVAKLTVVVAAVVVVETLLLFVITVGISIVDYVIVKSWYEGDIVFITQSRGGAEAEGNKNDITRVDGI